MTLLFATYQPGTIKIIDKVSAFRRSAGSHGVLFVCSMIMLFLTGCSNTKFLADDEKLYTYTWFSEKGFGGIEDKPLKAYELYSVARVETNRAILGLPRTRLLIYNYMKPESDWGPLHWFYNLTAQPPVLLSQVDPEFRRKVMEQRLYDMGHFDSNIDLDVKIYGKHEKKARAKYNILFRPAYDFRELRYIGSGRSVDSLVHAALPNSLIVTGENYWVKTLEQERLRLSHMLRDEGFYYFQPENFYFFADTTAGHRSVDMTLLIKDQTNPKSFYQYSVNEITVNVLSKRPGIINRKIQDTVQYEGISVVQADDAFRPEILGRAISINKDSLYHRLSHENTTRYLQGMQAFSSVDIRFEETDTSERNMHAFITLTPLKPVRAGLEVNFATKSNDFLGPSAKASLTHLNLFRGAEQLTLEVDGGFEWQKRSKRREYELGINSFEIGSRLKLVIPRFLAPVSIRNQSERYVPKTSMSIGIRALQRVQYYNLNLSQVRFGYNWSSSSRSEYTFDPVLVDYLRLTKQSEEFREYLALYPEIARAFEQQMIPAGRFSYTFTPNPRKKQMNQFFYNGTVELAGNLVSGIYLLSGAGPLNAGEPNSLLGTPYSQYARMTNDFRYYYNFNQKKQIAMRLLIGAGVPYGNSSVLPYVKQYFSGGSQDVRAFYARTIGPGSYTPADTIPKGALLDQSGDMKLTASIEYRFPVTYRTNGAIFLDAGNVWLLHEDASRPGGEFQWDSFYRQIAIGTGLGLRFDLDFLIVRLDAAVPFRKPNIEGDKKWIFNQPDYLKEIIFSLAVGYPF